MELIKFGTEINGFTVEGVTITGGERYYFLVDKFGTVSLMPESVLITLNKPTDK